MSTQVTPHFINGNYTSGSGGKIFLNRQPIDNSIISTVHEATRTDVDAAVSAVSDPEKKAEIKSKITIAAIAMINSIVMTGSSPPVSLLSLAAQRLGSEKHSRCLQQERMSFAHL